VTITHSKEYIEKFRKSIQLTYNNESYMDFLLVPSLASKPVLSYLPFINYTDKLSSEIEDLKELAKESNYLIRTLNPDYTDFQKDDPVTMRIDIDSNHHDELILIAKSRCRTKIRKSYKNYNYTLRDGEDCIEDFYKIVAQTYHRHGTPMIDKNLFYNLQKILGDKIIFFVVYDENNTPAAAMSTCIDGKLACCPWGGVEESFTRKFAGYFLYFEIIKTVTERFDIKIFDFGRSPYDGPTYKFKSQFGAKPLKIDLIKPHNDDIYSKYSLASDIWKKLPRFLVDIIGPRITKYLADL
jgi:lipid II:glycine glycyltransferase (peptidoglycan interpeptide bridge formation enzyme)